MTENCNVLIYHQENENLGFARAAWTWWVFKTYGHSKVSIIDGGLPQWEYDVTDVIPSEQMGNYKASWNPNTFILYEDLKILVDGARAFRETTDFQILDVRAAELYNGSASWVSTKKGHIPYAINVPSTYLYTNGRIRDIPEIEEILTQLGVKKGLRTIIYSETVLEAALTYFIMSQVPGYEPLEVYDGGWEEWSIKYSDAE